MSTLRDNAMARLAAATVSLQDASTSVNLVLTLFCDPSEDGNGEARLEELETAFMSCHLAAIAISKAQEAMKAMDGDDLAEPEDEEPTDDDGEEEE